VRPRAATRRIAVLLSCVAGAVDAIGYIVLAHLFTAHMSGNAVALGAAIGQAHWDTAIERAITIALFAAGIAAGTVAGDVAAARGGRHPTVAVFALEMALLAALLVCGGRAMGADGIAVRGWRFYGLVALPTLAMGMQNATLRSAGRLRVRTTYISGVLTHLVSATVQTLWRPRRGRSPARAGRTGEIALYGGVLVSYILGAVAASVAELSWGTVALVLPLAGLAVVIASDLAHPREVVRRGR
jgi:uncharacterized membrane protein YoaK (UPF0700 family)